MEDLQELLDGMAGELADLVEQRKILQSQEKEIKEKMMETMKGNNLNVWAFEKGKIAYQSRVSYSDWNVAAVRSKIGELSFDEVVNIRVGKLRNKLTEMGMELDEHGDFLSTVASANESEWVVFRQKS
tara:strand:- start:266 stop:649 length:384 start_codon:yes stop_codon:yes gene_type:complete